MPTQNIYDLVDTWNASGTTFTAIKMAVTDTASAAGSLLMDLQVGGSSRFRVTKDGSLQVFTPNNGLTQLTTRYGFSYFGGGSAGDTTASAFTIDASNTRFKGRSTAEIGWVNSGTDGNATLDTILTRRAAANLRLGAADAAAPVAQTLSVQSVVAGTTNTAGANLTITGSQGTGTGAGGSIVFQVAPAGSSGTAQNALATALTIAGDGTIAVNNPTSANISLAITGNVTSTGDFRASNFIRATSGVIATGNSFYVAWGSSNDVILARDAANTLALRNGANAQTFRVYNMYTDDSNYIRGELTWDANGLRLASTRAGTGGNRSITIAPSDGNIYTLGNLLFLGVDNTYDIGAAAASRPRNLFLGSYAQFSEMTAPAAPATNNVRIYAEDNGSGKTRLMALFPTGAAVQIAIEP